MLKKVDGKYKLASSEPGREPDTSRRELVARLAGILGASAFLKGCATPGEAMAGADQEQNLARAVSSLSGTSDGILWFDTYAELKATAGSTTSTGPVIAMCRDVNLGGPFIWTSDVTTPESIMVFRAPTSSPTGSWKRVHSGPTNVRWFGAKGDGTTNDTAAIQAAIDELALGAGGELYFPPGYYRITQTVHVGVPIFSSYAFAVERTEQLSDTDITFISGSLATNKSSYRPVSLTFAPNAFIVADFTPSVPTPAVAYNLDNYYGTATLRNLSVISMAAFDDEFELPNLEAGPAENKIIGLFAFVGCAVIDKALFVSLGYGLATVASYWCSVRDVAAFACGDGMSLAQGSGMTISNVVFFYCKRGIVFDGASTKIMSIHTEQVNYDLVIFAADCCTFGPGYLEDSRTYTTSTPKTYLTSGVTDNNVTNCVFDNLRIGNAGTKRAISLLNTARASFINVRTYAGTVVSSASSGVLMNCDFDIDGQGWTNFGYKSSPLSRLGGEIMPGSTLALRATICYPFSGANFGTIASLSSAVVALTSYTAISYNAYVATVQITGGGNTLCNFTAHIVSGTPKIEAANPTSGSIALTSVSGNLIIHYYETFTP